jgi:hypothetical protein
MASGLTSGLGTQFCSFCTVFDQSGGDEAWQTRLSSHVLCFFTTIYHHCPIIHVHFPAQKPRCHGLEDGGTGSAEVGNSAAGTTPRTQWAPWIPINLWIHGVSNFQTNPGRGGRHFDAFLLIPTIWSVCMAIWLYMTDGLLICCVLNPKCVTLWPYFKNNHSLSSWWLQQSAQGE